MTRIEWDRMRCIGFIIGLTVFGSLMACNKRPPDQETNWHQEYVNQATVVCRDGTAYLTGFVDRSMFLSPYILNGHFVKCDSNNKVIKNDGGDS